MHIRHDGTLSRRQVDRVASVRGGEPSPFRQNWTISLNRVRPYKQILASASYDASIYLFADDPDSDWSPFQKLNPSLPETPASVLSADPSSSSVTTDSSPSDFVVPPLQDPETVWSVAFSPCGQYLASGGDGGGIRIWERRCAPSPEDTLRL